MRELVVRLGATQVRNGRLHRRNGVLEIRRLSSPLPLAERLNEATGKSGKRLPVLVEVKLSSEETKAGLEPDSDEARELLERLAELENLQMRGLMTRYGPCQRAHRGGRIPARLTAQRLFTGSPFSP